MKIERFIVVPLFAFLAACGSGSSGGGGAPPAPLTAKSVPCSQIGELRDLRTKLQTVTNPATGDEMEYVVIGDGAKSNDLIVMFPGTGQIIPGWPIEMITNSTYSPKIKFDLEYNPLEDAPVSLCHDYHLLLFDYPGVGMTPAVANLTKDHVASDVDNMLNTIAGKAGLDTSVIDPLGWSLGTTMAMKYAFLSPTSDPARTIHNILLVAAGPGGSLQGEPNHNPAACEATMFTALLTASGSLKNELDGDLTKLIFPYDGQTAANNGTNSGCTATITDSVALSVTLHCAIENNCDQYVAASVIDIKTPPWSITGGIGDAVFLAERQEANDFGVAYCSTPARGFTSSGCTAYGPLQMSITNGGICRTDTSAINAPVASNCADFAISGHVTLLNGYEDLFDQWTYGRAMITGLQASMGMDRASMITYPGPAGHGVLVQHPAWTQVQLRAAMGG